MTDIEILRGGNVKVGDTLPKLRLKLLEDSKPFNLTDYSLTIKLQRSDADQNKIDTSNNLTIENELRGIVSYKWQEGDTDTTGTYMLEIVAEHDTNGNEISFPNEEYATAFIEERL